MPRGRAVRNFLRGRLRHRDSATFQAHEEKLVGGGDAAMRSTVLFPGAFLPTCAPHLPAVEEGQGRDREGERGCGLHSPGHARICLLICQGGCSHRH